MQRKFHYREGLWSSQPGWQGTFYWRANKRWVPEHRGQRRLSRPKPVFAQELHILCVYWVFLSDARYFPIKHTLLPNCETWSYHITLSFSDELPLLCAGFIFAEETYFFFLIYLMRILSIITFHEISGLYCSGKLTNTLVDFWGLCLEWYHSFYIQGSVAHMQVSGSA